MELHDILIKTKVQAKRRYESMLFEYKTTPLTDFRNGYNWEPKLKNEYKKPVRVRKTWPYPLRENHTMTDWKDGHPVPFDLFMRPKEIIRRDPRHIQEYFEPEHDFEREIVRKTRPRLVMTPAARVDDANERQREIIIKDTYVTTYQKHMCEGRMPAPAPTEHEKPKEDGDEDRETNRRLATAGLKAPPLAPVKPYARVEAPFPGKPAPSNPVTLPRFNPPVVSPDWRMDSVSWSNRQMRSYCEPTKEFWLGYPLKKCGPCNATDIVRKQRTAKHLAKRKQ